MSNLFKRLSQGAKSIRETGMTMIEIVVALALLAVVTTFTTATIMNTMATSDRFGQGVHSEGELLDAVSLISRDVSLAYDFQFAGPDAVIIDTIDGDTESTVYYFNWNGNESSIPDGTAWDAIRANDEDLPDEKGYLEYRVANGDTANPIIRMAIEGYNPGVNQNRSVFTYFDTTASEMPYGANNPERIADSQLGNIRRVEMDFSSRIEGARNNAMEMRTSASLRLESTAGKNVPVSRLNPKDQPPIDPTNPTPLNGSLDAPNLFGELPRPDNGIVNTSFFPTSTGGDRTGRTAYVSWSAVSGADSYQLELRKGTGAWEVLDQVAHVDTMMDYKLENLDWGQDYHFRALALNHAAESGYSNEIHLRVVPEATQFIRIDPKRGQNGESTNGWTVARELMNYLAWDRVDGAHVTYKLRERKEGSGWVLASENNQTTASRGPKSYGDVFEYEIRASNPPIHVNASAPDWISTQSGGESKAGAHNSLVKLISPPIAPVLDVTAYNDLVSNGSVSTVPENHVRVTNGSSIATELGFTFYSSSLRNSNGGFRPTNKPQNTSVYIDNLKTTGSYKTDRGWGTTLWYFAEAYNDAGASPLAPRTNNIAEQHPGPFDITDLANPEGYANFDAQQEEMDRRETIKQIGVMTGTWGKSLGTINYDMDRSITRYGSESTIQSAIHPGTKKRVDFESDIRKHSATKGRSFKADGVSPGTVYSVRITARADNDLVRSTPVRKLLTRPDVPQSGINEGICYANGAYGTSMTHGMYVRANTVPKYGRGDRVDIYHKLENPSGSMYSAKYATNQQTIPDGGVLNRATSTNTLAHVFLPGINYKGHIAFRNQITTANVPNSAVHYGNTAGERVSEKPNLDFAYLAEIYAGCNYASGASGPDGDGNRVSGMSGWVVHPAICYGYQPGHYYGNYWVRSANPQQRGYTTAARNASGYSNSSFQTRVSLGGSGCMWRLDPMRGKEPSFASVTAGVVKKH